MNTNYQLKTTSNDRLFPLFNPPQSKKLRPLIVVGVGLAGHSIVRSTSAKNSVCIDDQASPDVWAAAFRKATNRPGANCVLEGIASIQVLIIGNGEHIQIAWDSIAERMQLAGTEADICIIVLELGSSLETEIPSECSAWFQLSSCYADGELDSEQLTILATQLIERQAMTKLFAFASRTHPKLPVGLTATLGWLPETSVGELVACQLRIQVRRSLMRSNIAFGRDKALFHHSSRATLTDALRDQLAMEAADALDRYKSHQANVPVTDFEFTVHIGEAQSMATIERWCEQQWQVVLRSIVAAWREPAELATVRQQISVCLASLKQIAKTAEDRQRASMLRLEQTVRRGKAADARRISKHSRGSRGRTANWWRAWRVGRLIKQFYRLRTEQLLACYERCAILKIYNNLSVFKSRIEELLTESADEEQTMQAMLLPNHPCQFPLHDEQSLELLVEQLTDDLLRASSYSGDGQVWRISVASVVADLAAGEKPWQRIVHAAQLTAEGLSKSTMPSADACRVLTPQYRPERLQQLMLRSALPGRLGQAGVPTSSTSLFCHHVKDGHHRSLPIALRFQWT